MRSFFKLLTSVIFCFFIFKSFSQKRYKDYYSNDNLKVSGYTKIIDGEIEKTGDWKYYYPNGTVWLEGAYKRNKPIGKWTAYYPNGKKYITGEYKIQYLYNDVLRSSYSVGEWLSFWDTGKVACIYTFDNTRITTQVVNTKFIEKYPYPSGKYGAGDMALRIKYSFTHFEKPYIDLVESTISNGKISMGNFSRYGDWNQYYKNGSLHSKGGYNWKTNKENGEWKFYDKEGNFTNSTTYKDGKVEGLKVKNYKNGNKKKFYEKDGFIIGELKLWDKEGNLIEDSYGDGKGVINRKYFYKNGNKKSEGKNVWDESKKENINIGNWSYYYENGNKRIEEIYNSKGKHIGYYEQHLKDGSKVLSKGNGVYHIFEDNKLVMKSEHKNGSRDGITTWYYPNGQIEQSALYKYDENSKPYGLRWEILKSFHKDGTPRKRGTLKNGNGTWVSYDENGNISGVKKFKNGVEIE